MPVTNFSTKCKILGEMWDYREIDNEIWEEFFRWADLGLPLAYYAAQDMVIIKQNAQHNVEEVWGVLCAMIEVDPNGAYLDLWDIFGSSPNSQELRGTFT